MTEEPRCFSPVAAGFSNYEGDFWLPLVLAQGQEALDLVPLVTNVVLEEHYLVVGVVVVVDIGVIPINSRGEKQRMHLRDGFLADQLDPIYVAYNM